MVRSRTGQPLKTRLPFPPPKRQVDEATSTVMLDTSGGAWITPSTASLSGDDLTRRCRHAVASLGPFVFVYGGLKGSQLLVRARARVGVAFSGLGGRRGAPLGDAAACFPGCNAACALDPLLGQPSSWVVGPQSD